MRINDDLTRSVIVHAGAQDWIPSPMPGVERRMLFRIGEEKARATSIVRYAPGSAFSAHTHGGGEEFLVLDGIFQDEHGDYPAGSYIRNPPGTRHVPASRDGCTIFVRLWQFRQADQEFTIRHPGEGEHLPLREGVAESRLLFADGQEEVLSEDWQPRRRVTLANAEGIELLMTQGSAVLNGEELTAQSWARVPAGTVLDMQTGPEGATVWIKRGPLLHADVCPFD